jgi:hypothetical protein
MSYAMHEGAEEAHAEPAPAGPTSVADWALDETLKAIQGGAQEKDAIQAATGLGPTDLRRALEALVEDGVVRETEDGWEADMTATPVEVRVEAPEGVIGPAVWEPPAATGPVTVGVPWESREDADEHPPEPSPLEEEAREAVPHGAAPAQGSVSSTADGDVFAARLSVRLSFPTPDDPVEVARMMASRLEELVEEVFGLDATAVLEEVLRTETVYSR